MLVNDDDGPVQDFDLSDGTTDDGDGEDDAAPEPSLADFDDDTRAIAERIIAREREAALAPFRDIGFDVNRDGRPLIADAGKIATYTGMQSQRQQPTAPPAQQAAAAQTPAAEDVDEELDLLSATTADLDRRNDRRTAKALQPLLQEIQRLSGLVSQQYRGDALSSVRSAVEARSPEILPWLDHPDFEAAYRQQIEGVDPALLNDPKWVAAIAAVVRIDLDKERMPMPRDTQGRFVTPEQQARDDAQARHLAARQGLQGTPPARGAGVQRGGNAPDARMDEGVGYLREINAHLPPGVAKRPDLTAAEWDAAGNRDFESWKAAMDRSKAAAANGQRRR